MRAFLLAAAAALWAGQAGAITYSFAPSILTSDQYKCGSWEVYPIEDCLAEGWTPTPVGPFTPFAFEMTINDAALATYFDIGRITRIEYHRDDWFYYQESLTIVGTTGTLSESRSIPVGTVTDDYSSWGEYIFYHPGYDGTEWDIYHAISVYDTATERLSSYTLDLNEHGAIARWTSRQDNDQLYMNGGGTHWAGYLSAELAPAWEYWTGTAHWWTGTAIDDPDYVAPVPVPAAAAMLPLGIGALAMIRRRKIRSSGRGVAKRLLLAAAASLGLGGQAGAASLSYTFVGSDLTAPDGSPSISAVKVSFWISESVLGIGTVTGLEYMRNEYSNRFSMYVTGTTGSLYKEYPAVPAPWKTDGDLASSYWFENADYDPGIYFEEEMEFLGAMSYTFMFAENGAINRWSAYGDNDGYWYRASGNHWASRTGYDDAFGGSGEGTGYWVTGTAIDDPDYTAPVPIPVSATLLPLGVGALAFMRRRKAA